MSMIFDSNSLRITLCKKVMVGLACKKYVGTKEGVKDLHTLKAMCTCV